MQAPANSGSSFWNYKNSHSIILLAVADANAKFIMVDVGAEGRCSDGGVLMDSEIGEALINDTLNLPDSCPIETNGLPLPYVFVADEAFGLSSYMMRPYPSRNLTYDKKVFNYRQSRARRIVECAFGIFSARWLIFRKPICATVENIVRYTQAAVCLHNFIMSKDLLKLPEYRNYSALSVLERKRINYERSQQTMNYSKDISKNGVAVRDAFKKYFCENEIPGQREKVERNDF